MIIQHNMLMMNNCRIGKQLQVQKSKVMEKLSSGYRINRAADDAAGLAISEKMNARIRSLNRCQNNIEEGISLAQTADGALHEVNNMLNRVSELCVQAANDTNTADDRSKIAAEITQIYDDMDRIFETTDFNTIPVFRHDGNNFYGPKAKYLYHEKVTVLPPDDFSSWGAGAFPTKTFDMAKGATKATATMTLGPGINTNDVTTLNGTSFYLKKGSSVTTIKFGTEQSSGYVSSNTYYINTNSYPSVQNAFQAVNNYISEISDVKLSGNKVTFAFYSSTKTNTIYADGNTAVEYVEDGSVGNGYTIYTDGNVLNPIDSGNNKLKYSSSVTQDLVILRDRAATDTLTQEEITHLTRNSIYINPPYNSIKISDMLTLTTSTTVGDIRQAIATTIGKQGNYSVTYDGLGDTMQITIANRSSTSRTYAYLYESNSSSIVYRETTASPNITVTQTQQATAEKQAKYIVKVDDITDNLAYSFKMNGSKYLVYDPDDYASTAYNSTYSQPYFSAYSTGTLSKQEKIYSMIKSYAGNFYVKTLDDGSLELTAKSYNDNSGITIETATTEFQLRTTSQDILIEPVDSSEYHYYTQSYEVTINFKEALGDTFDTTALYGKGFMLHNTYYQFTGSGDTNPLYSNNTKAISLDGVSTYADLCSKIAAATGLTVEEDPVSAGTLVLKGTCKTNSSGNSTLNFTDGGPRGTFTGSVTSSGGATYKNPQAEIDFSQYDMQNLDELYGTGFRITCATCPGEFINVMFCHDKSELNYPDSFEFTDDQGNKNTIHNYMVELKDVTDASQIAANIADQLKNDLDHFTEVKVSDTNPSVLVAQDKRSKDQTGRGQILAGVYTNFTYHVDAEKIPDMSELVDGGKKGTEAYYSYCMIYAADSTEKPYIAVHLPVFTVTNLKLDDPANGFESYEQITNILKQSRNAAEVVSMARSKIGADQNCLEHALSYAENAEEQLTAAASRIRDLDMAKGVSELAKLELLSNVQQSLLSQLADQPQRILSLLQQ